MLADIVRIGEVTIRKRLTELQQTPTASLTVDQFEALEDGSSGPIEKVGYDSLPPSLIRNREKERKEYLKALSEGKSGLDNSKVPVLAVADVCAELPTGDQILAVANSVLSSIGGDEGLRSLVAEFTSDEETDIAVCELSSDNEDEDLDAYILTEEEAAAKSAIWHEWNKPYLEEWSMRDAKRKREQELAANSTKKPVGRLRDSSAGPHESASAATQEVMEKKAKSLVKTDILDSLFRK
jgi:transcription factor IIIB 90 kDa subunit